MTATDVSPPARRQRIFYVAQAFMPGIPTPASAAQPASAGFLPGFSPRRAARWLKPTRGKPAEAG
jgi:hypothetical protein